MAIQLHLFPWSPRYVKLVYRRKREVITCITSSLPLNSDHNFMHFFCYIQVLMYQRHCVDVHTVMPKNSFARIYMAFGRSMCFDSSLGLESTFFFLSLSLLLISHSTPTILSFSLAILSRSSFLTSEPLPSLFHCNTNHLSQAVKPRHCCLCSILLLNSTQSDNQPSLNVSTCKLSLTEAKLF